MYCCCVSEPRTSVIVANVMPGSFFLGGRERGGGCGGAQASAVYAPPSTHCTSVRKCEALAVWGGAWLGATERGVILDAPGAGAPDCAVAGQHRRLKKRVGVAGHEVDALR